VHKVDVVVGGALGDHKRRPVHADVQRLFDREGVNVSPLRLRGHASHRTAGRDPAHGGFLLGVDMMCGPACHGDPLASSELLLFMRVFALYATVYRAWVRVKRVAVG
jgi:hypothetical protein